MDNTEYKGIKIEDLNKIATNIPDGECVEISPLNNLIFKYRSSDGEKSLYMQYKVDSGGKLTPAIYAARYLQNPGTEFMNIVNEKYTFNIE